MAATANSTPRCCKPSAPASTLRPSRALRQRSLRLPDPALLLRHPTRQQPRQQTDPMIDSVADADCSTVCARLDNVSKLFGSFAALRQVSVDFEPGRCYVLLGENGAGKSTLLRILAGLLRPSFGKVTVFGENDPHDARERIGYMSHAPMLYDELTAEENLSYFASLYPDRQRGGRACLAPAEALRQVGLDPELTRTLGQYSQGMRQRTSR